MQLEGKNVGFFGLGVSNIGALKLCYQKQAQLTLVNQGPTDSWNWDLIGKEIGSVASCFSQDQEVVEKRFSQMDLIILSPGIPRNHPLLKMAHEKNVPIWNEIELALQFINYPVIAITGTNGKTTTATLCALALKNEGLNVFLGGNIGRSVCDVIIDQEKPDIMVLELSSFQLESLFSLKPKSACILNLASNHGERYTDISDYQKAKENIFRLMDEGDHLVLGQNSSSWSLDHCICQISHLDTYENCKAELEKLISLENIVLEGKHNLTNIWFVSRLIKPFVKNLKCLEKTISEFSGVAHRLERVILNKSPLKFFNDAKSTNWFATENALYSIFEDCQRPLVLIVGGQKRGHGDLPSKELMTFINENVDKVILTGESSSDLNKIIDHGVVTVNLEEAIEWVKLNCSKGTILYSPAYPSFDQFKNYAHRGESFKQLIRSRFE